MRTKSFLSAITILSTVLLASCTGVIQSIESAEKVDQRSGTLPAYTVNENEIQDHDLNLKEVFANPKNGIANKILETYGVSGNRILGLSENWILIETTYQKDHEFVLNENYSEKATFIAFCDSDSANFKLFRNKKNIADGPCGPAFQVAYTVPAVEDPYQVVYTFQIDNSENFEVNMYQEGN